MNMDYESLSGPRDHFTSRSLWTRCRIVVCYGSIAATLDSHPICRAMGEPVDREDPMES